MRGALAALVALPWLVLAAGGGSAQVFSSVEWHYHFTAPEDWDRSTSPGVDVMFVSHDGSGANMNAGHVLDASAKNETVWLREQAELGLQAIQNQFGGTVVQPANGFTAGSGRLAADYIIDYTMNGVHLRVRQVIFASDLLDVVWIVTFTSEVSWFATHAPAWNTATDSFAADNEEAGSLIPNRGGGIMTYALVGALGGAAAGGAAYFVLQKQRRSRAAAAPIVQAPASTMPGQPWPAQQPPWAPKPPAPPQGGQPPVYRPPPRTPPGRP